MWFDIELRIVGLKIKLVKNRTRSKNYCHNDRIAFLKVLAMHEVVSFERIE